MLLLIYRPLYDVLEDNQDWEFLNSLRQAFYKDNRSEGRCRRIWDGEGRNGEGAGIHGKVRQSFLRDLR